MLIATLTTDYGLDDHYVASLKGALYFGCSNLLVVDITHTIPPFDIIKCSHIMRNGTKSFPPGSIHITTIGLSQGNMRFLLVEKDSKYYICPDNGLICLIFPDQQFNAYIINNINKNSSYAEINQELAYVCKKINNGEKPESFSTYTTSYMVSTHMVPVKRENMIRGSVFYIDNFGNVLVNIPRETFEELVKPGDKFLVMFKNYRIDKLSLNYNDAKEGDLSFMFNENGWMEISLKDGRASSLIGFNIGDTVLVEMTQEAAKIA